MRSVVVCLLRYAVSGLVKGFHGTDVRKTLELECTASLGLGTVSVMRESRLSFEYLSILSQP